MRLILYRILPLYYYLRILSIIFFFSFSTGLLKKKKEYKFYYFLKNYVKKGDVIIDIGANMGYYSKLFSSWTGAAGHVHSVEPVKEMRTQLKKNVQWCKNVTIYPFALGAEEKDIRLGNNSRKQLGYMASGRHSVLEENEDALDTFPAKMKMGSRLFSKVGRINLIKIDVEGHEVPILKDMTEILSKSKPTILLESGGDSRRTSFQLLNDIGYNAFKLSEGKLTQLNEVNSEDDDLLYIHPNRIIP